MWHFNSQQPSLPVGRQCSSKLAPLALATALVIGVAPGIASATCAAAIAKDAALATVSSVTSVATAGMQITASYYDLIDSLTRYANGLNQDSQKRTNAAAGLVDKEVTSLTAASMGEVRSTIATKFVPSQAVCGEASALRRLDGTRAHYASFRTARQAAGTGWSNNSDPGSKSGTLGAMTTVWKERCSKYADVANMGNPPGCTGPANTDLIDLDVQPFRALLDPVAFKGPEYEQGAVDAIRMLTDVAPADAVRGNALIRNEGQAMHVLKMRDTTRMNLARGVLENIAAMRSVKAGETQSRMSRYLELVMGQSYDPATNSLSGVMPAVLAAKEPNNAGVQLVSSRIATQQALIFSTLEVLEGLVAMEAVDLAIKAERNRVGSASTRTIKGN